MYNVLNQSQLVSVYTQESSYALVYFRLLFLREKKNSLQTFILVVCFNWISNLTFEGLCETKSYEIGHC